MQSVHPAVTVLSNKLSPRLGLDPSGATILISSAVTAAAPVWARASVPDWLLDAHAHWLPRLLVALALAACASAMCWRKAGAWWRRDRGRTTRAVVHSAKDIESIMRAMQDPDIDVRGIAADVPSSVDKGYYTGYGRLIYSRRLTPGYPVDFRSATQGLSGSVVVKEDVVNQPYSVEGRSESERKQTRVRLEFTLRAPPGSALTADALVDEFLQAREDALASASSRMLFCADCTTRGDEFQETPMGMFTEEKRSEAERAYIQSFVSKHLPHIWTRVRRVVCDPAHYTSRCQPASVRYLLHGSPGTGKSSLPYRLARATGRHLVVINLRAYVDHVRDLKAALSQLCGRVVTYTAANAIVVLEELDETVRIMRDREAAATSDDVLRSVAVAATSEKALSAKVVDTSNHLTLKGLLSLLQGPKPVDGQVLFANTNDLALIEDAVPALLRRGRMNVYHMGYWDWQELVQYTRRIYPDGNGLEELAPCEINVPPSEIVDLAMDREYEEFVEALRAALTDAAK